jgi:hypothetical protein
MKPILIAFLLFSTTLFADTLVLKNGKKIQGTIIKEDAESYKIKDLEGIVILVKKSQINPEATVINRKSTATPENKPEVKSVPDGSQSTPSVVDAARQAREKKKGNVRVLRKEDLDKMPEVSIIGTDEPIEERPAESETESSSASATSEKSEEYWKSETRKFAMDIRRVEEDIAQLNKDCEELGKQAAYALIDPGQYVMVNGVWIPVGGYDPSVIQHAQDVCHQAEQAKSELAKIHAELEEFQDYARRQGALPGWVDPDRVR